MAPKMMSKAAVIAQLADKLQLRKGQVAELMAHFHVLAAKEAKKNGFVVPGFGRLVLRNRKARAGRNPQTGEAIRIPAKRVVRFRVAKAMKDAILGGRK